MDNRKVLELLDSKEAYEAAIEALQMENESLRAMLRDNPTLADMDAMQFEINYLRSELIKLFNVVLAYRDSGMHTHGDRVFESETLKCPRCNAERNLYAVLSTLER